MRKILYSLLAVLALSCTFVSCSDDDGDAPAPTGNPAVAAAGTYTGTWYQVLNGDTTTAPGTLTITATDSAFTADINVTCKGLKLNDNEVANIAFKGNTTSFDFSNVNGKTLGSFAGTIIDNNATMLFTKSQRKGRKRYNFNYSFVGQKNAE